MQEMERTGVLEKTALAFGQMNEPPGARMRVALTGLTMAEYFRDARRQDMLLFFMDDISSVMCRPARRFPRCWAALPCAVGYQPTLATELGELEERITSTTQGSITSVQAVYVPADDLTDPAPATTFTHLDATTKCFPAASWKWGSILPWIRWNPASRISGSAYRGPGALPRGAGSAKALAALSGIAGYFGYPRYG